MLSVKKNLLLNGINTVTQILFPVITFPYAARVLLPEGIGVINFLNSIISYIVLLTSIGIPMYAVKEIAKYRDYKEQRDKITVEIIILSTFLCLLGYIGVWILAKFIPQIHQQTSLFYILSLTILFTAIGVNWFYQGIEDFKFITIRALIFRTLSAICLFLFVKSPSDLLIYACIVVGSTVGNNFINFIHLRKYLDIHQFKFKQLNIKRHLYPSVQTFVLTLVISLYTSLNPIMLGFMTDDAQVGYFTAGIKITHIAITLIASIGTVLLPRCSNLIMSGDFVTFKRLIIKTLQLTQCLSYPMCAACVILAIPLTDVFCGNEFLDSVPVLVLNAPVIILSIMNNFLCIQILYPMNKTRICILGTVFGGLVNIVLNTLIIPVYGATGAAISVLISEIAVLIILLSKGFKYYPFRLRQLISIKYLAASIIMSTLVYMTTFRLDSDIIKLCLGTLVGVFAYGIILFFIKDRLIIQLSQEIKKKIPL